MSEIIAQVFRGDLVESLHRGDIAVVDGQGRIVAAVGDPEKVTYMRSSAKPIQALPVVETGAADAFGLTEEELAVICASHSAEQEHIQVVRGILEKIGLDESFLACGVHAPLDEVSARLLILEGKDPGPIHNNCSGKHAGMLAMAVHLGFSLQDYFLPDHPLQQLILTTMSEMTGLARDEIRIGVDGCGVPVFGLPLRRMAWAYARMISPGLEARRAEAARRIVTAMTRHPVLVAGHGRFNAELLLKTRGRVWGKSGAEGVFCLGLPGPGLGVAVKVEDGSSRAIPPVVLEVLQQLGVLTAEEERELAAFRRPDNTNHRGQVVGRIQPVFQLTRSF